MQSWIKIWVIRMLEDALSKIESDSCNMSQEEIDALFDVLGNKRMNKVEAAQFVHLSESQFDNEVRVGRLCKGEKLIKGDSKVYWLKRDLIIYMYTWRKNKYNGEK